MSYYGETDLGKVFCKSISAKKLKLFQRAFYIKFYSTKHFEKRKK